MLRSSIPLFGFLTLTIACTFDTRSESVPDGSPPDSSPTDAGSDAGFSATHLLLSEIKTSDGRNLREFIEIFNPTASAIDLDEYYLADTALYARLPAILGGEPAVVAAGDFIARFPDASTIEAGGVAVVALRSNPLHPFVGADFGVEPNDATPRMVEAFPASISSVPQLENVGEGIALFRWNGASDLVEDLDLFNAGFQIPPGDALANKTGIAIDGPDVDDETSTYADDAYTMPMPIRANGFSEAFVRIAGETGETAQDGNGVNGHDETTEDIRSSWSFASDSPGSTELSL